MTSRTLTRTEQSILSAARTVAEDHGITIVDGALVGRRGRRWSIEEWATLTAARLGYSEDQERDEYGRWSTGAGGGPVAAGPGAGGKPVAAGPAGIEQVARVVQEAAAGGRGAAAFASLRPVEQAVVQKEAEDARYTVENTVRDVMNDLGVDVVDGEFVDEMGNPHSIDEIVADVAAGIETDDSGTISILASPDTLGLILDDGRFKNQFETGTSTALFDPAMRQTFEAGHFGVDPSASPMDKPIYGTYNFDETLSSGVGFYGGVVVDLKDTVRERATVTLGDSLNSDLVGIPMGASGLPEDRLLAAAGPDYVREAAIVSLSNYPGFENVTDDLGSDWQMQDYYEAQIHGGVTVDDIAHVYFKDPPPPDSELTARLDEKGISWASAF